MKTKQSSAARKNHSHTQIDIHTRTHTFAERKRKINGYAARKSVSRALAKLFANEKDRERETMRFVRITMKSAMFAFIVRFFISCPAEKRQQKKMWGAYAPHKDIQSLTHTFIYYSLTIYDFQRNMQICACKFCSFSCFMLVIGACAVCNRLSHTQNKTLLKL